MSLGAGELRGPTPEHGRQSWPPRRAPMRTWSDAPSQRGARCASGLTTAMIGGAVPGARA